MIRVLLTMALLIWFVTPVHSAELGGGVEAFKSRDYSDAMKLLTPLAEAGDPLALYYVGRMFEEGLGVDQDYKLAAEWYRGAAVGYIQSSEQAARSFNEKKAKQHGDWQEFERCQAYVAALSEQIRKMEQTLERIRREIGSPWQSR